MRHAIFLDRDGVINKALIKNGLPFSPRTINDFEILPGVEKALNLFHDLGFLNIVATNQPDIARCLMSEQILNEMHDLIRLNLVVDDIFVCPHDDSENCSCRKPKPGMILDAAAKWGIDLTNSYFIGDTWKDIHAGRAAGCATVLLECPYNEGLESDYRVASLFDIIDIIKK
jgi:D-glycero-D-manno-heptose 1,7-bisphosphate phosphatase